MSEAAKKIRARMSQEPDYPCMVKSEILGWADEAEIELAALREVVLDVLIEHQQAMPEDARKRLRKAVGRVE